MKTITIGFSKNTNSWAIGSLLIRWFMNRPFSHTYLKFKEDQFSDSTISQETGAGCGYISETRFLSVDTVVAEFPIQISDELYAEIMQDCHKYAGVKYGYLQNLGLAYARIMARLGIRLKRNPISDGMNCSEWMCYILMEVYGKWTDLDPNLVAPDDVYSFLQSRK